MNTEEMAAILRQRQRDASEPFARFALSIAIIGETAGNASIR